MLSGSKLGSAFAGNKNRMLAICFACSIVGAVISYQALQISGLQTQLADKTREVDSQNQLLAQYESTIASQRQDIDSKTALLDTMNLQIAVLEEEITTNEQLIASKTAETQLLSTTVDSQRAQLQLLQSQALQFQNEINSLKKVVQDNEARIRDLEKQVSTTQAQLDSSKRIKVSHHGLGVTEDNRGVVFPIEVEIIGSGDGTISLDVKNVQYEASFQDAVRTAAAVASEYAGVSVSDKDIIVRFVNDDGGLIRVDGGSAGALVTGMIIAGLTDRQISPSTLITGTIKSDGTIGEIAGLESKAEAAANFGAKRMLVPEEQKFWHESMTIVGVSNIDEVMRFLAPG